jgi:adenosine deaminase CECR1
MVGSNKMSLMGWRTLVEWSFQYSMISQEEKFQRINTFRKEWEVFYAEIIETYGKIVAC